MHCHNVTNSVTNSASEITVEIKIQNPLALASASVTVIYRHSVTILGCPTHQLDHKSSSKHLGCAERTVPY